MWKMNYKNQMWNRNQMFKTSRENGDCYLKNNVKMNHKNHVKNESCVKKKPHMQKSIV